MERARVGANHEPVPPIHPARITRRVRGTAAGQVPAEMIDVQRPGRRNNGAEMAPEQIQRRGGFAGQGIRSPHLRFLLKICVESPQNRFDVNQFN